MVRSWGLSCRACELRACLFMPVDDPFRTLGETCLLAATTTSAQCWGPSDRLASQSFIRGASEAAEVHCPCWRRDSGLAARSACAAVRPNAADWGANGVCRE